MLFLAACSFTCTISHVHGCVPKIVLHAQNLVHEKLCFMKTLRIHESHVRSYLDYGDIVYDKPNNKYFTCKLERVQYKVCLAITGTIQGTSCECLYKELGLESLSGRRWVSRLTFSVK